MLTLARWLAAATSTEPARVAAGPVRCDRSGQLERHGVRYRAVDPRDGQRKRCYETVSATSLEEAKKELDYILKQIEKGVWRPPATEQPETPKAEPSFHEYASAWVERRSHEVDARTVEYWQWALSSHLLASFAELRPSQISVAAIDGYKLEKLRERERLEALRRERPKERIERGLSNGSVNKTLKALAMILDDAIEAGYIETNVVRGKRRRLKESKPRRTWLELSDVRAILDAAGKHRALLATMILAGLRVGELTALRWRDVDLANARLNISESKTDAGRRTVEVTPWALDELKAHKAASRYSAPDELVFCTGKGTSFNRSNVRQRILGGAIKAANEKLKKAGKPQIAEGITNHTCRRTFASLLYEAGASPAYVMAQMRHTSSALALEVYARKMERQRKTGARMDALIRGADWAQMGTNGVEREEALPAQVTEEAA